MQVCFIFTLVEVSCCIWISSLKEPCAMENTVDFMITSLMETLKYMDIKFKSHYKPSQPANKLASLSPEEQMDGVLAFYSDIIEYLWEIAQCISKTTGDEEERVGTIYMGSSHEGTYLPEISDGFDAFVMEEDTQTELQIAVEVIDSDNNLFQMADSKPIFKVITLTYLVCWRSVVCVMRCIALWCSVVA